MWKNNLELVHTTPLYDFQGGVLWTPLGLRWRIYHSDLDGFIYSDPFIEYITITSFLIIVVLIVLLNALQVTYNRFIAIDWKCCYMYNHTSYLWGITKYFLCFSCRESYDFLWLISKKIQKKKNSEILQWTRGLFKKNIDSNLCWLKSNQENLVQK